MSQQSLGARQHIAKLFVPRTRDSQGPRKSLEDRLNLVMARPAVHRLEVNIRPRPLGKTIKKVVDEFTLQVAYQAGLYLSLDDRRDSPAQIDCGDGEGLVHWHQEISRPQNPPFVA